MGQFRLLRIEGDNNVSEVMRPPTKPSYITNPDDASLGGMKKLRRALPKLVSGSIWQVF